MFVLVGDASFHIAFADFMKHQSKFLLSSAFSARLCTVIPSSLWTFSFEELEKLSHLACDQTFYFSSLFELCFIYFADFCPANQCRQNQDGCKQLGYGDGSKLSTMPVWWPQNHLWKYPQRDVFPAHADCAPGHQFHQRSYVKDWFLARQCEKSNYLVPAFPFWSLTLFSLEFPWSYSVCDAFIYLCW